MQTQCIKSHVQRAANSEVAMLENKGSVVRLKKLAQFLVSNPLKDKFVLIIKEPLPEEEKCCIKSSNY